MTSKPKVMVTINNTDKFIQDTLIGYIKGKVNIVTEDKSEYPNTDFTRISITLSDDAQLDNYLTIDATMFVNKQGICTSVFVDYLELWIFDTQTVLYDNENRINSTDISTLLLAEKAIFKFIG